MSDLRNFFAIEDEQVELTEHQKALIDQLADKIVQRRLAAPVIFFLEISKPLNFIGSQVMVFFEPIIQSLFSFKNYEEYRTLLERRDTIEHLLASIERIDAEQRKQEKEARKKRKEQRRAHRA
ncbi:hypothetical protein JXQ70_06030 [bacterium]|nr:hypothetical protein [bacterium]